MAFGGSSRYYVGFSARRVGPLSLAVVGTFSYSAALTTGRYYLGFSDKHAGGFHADFRFELESALNVAHVAAGGSAANWAITWDNVALAWTLASTASVTSATVSEAMRKVLGASSTSLAFASSSWSSQVRPWYVIAPAIDGMAFRSRPLERHALFNAHVGDGGTPRGTSATTSGRSSRWVQQHEPPAAVHASEAAGLMSWEDLFLHVAHGEPLAIVDTAGAFAGSSSARFDAHVAMRAQLNSDTYSPRMEQDNVATLWEVGFDAEVDYMRGET